MSQKDNSDELTEAQREEIRKIIRDEQESNPAPIRRREALKGGALLAGLATIGGGATESAAARLSSDSNFSAPNNTLDVDDSYRIAGQWYRGPGSAKPENPRTDEQVIWEVTGTQDESVIHEEYWTGSQWMTVSRETDVLNVGQLSNDLPAIASTNTSQPHGYSQYQDWSVINKTRLFGPSDLSWTSEHVYWPWVLKADEVLDDPFDTYYLYFSEDHSHGGIGLATFGEPGETPTQQGLVFDPHSGQDETPAVLWDDHSEHLKMTYHTTDVGDDQTTCWATSTDGVNWTDQGILFDVAQKKPGDSHNGYFRPFKFGERWIGGVKLRTRRPVFRMLYVRIQPPRRLYRMDRLGVCGA